MSIDNPCYRCTSDNPRWRGPKLGWLCLRCFSERTEPAVRVTHASQMTDSTDGEDLTPVVRDENDTGWTLYVYEEGPDEGVATFYLGRDIDVEDAVDEAKWILNKRAYERSHQS